MEEVRLETNEHGDGAFYLFLDGGIAAKMLVGINGDNLDAYHTEAMIEGKGYARKLFDAMAAYSRSHQLKVTPFCPYVHLQFKRHADQYADIWNKRNEK